MRALVFVLSTIGFLAAAVMPAAAQDAVPVVRRIVLSGARSVPADAVANAAAKNVVGRVGDSMTVRAAVDAVVAEYRRRGFPVAQAVATDLSADGTLRLTMAEGTVRHIVVRGNRKTRASIILAAMETTPGDVYKSDRVAGDRDRLARLGIFDDVTVAPEFVDVGKGEDTVGLVDVVVRVKERRTGNVAATLGLGDNTGLVGYIDLSESNFGGSAQQMAVQWQRWTQAGFDNNGRIVQQGARSAYNLSYFAPFLGRGRTAFGVDVYEQNTIFQPLFAGNEDSLRSYERRRGGKARVGKKLVQGLSLFLSARRDKIGYDAVPPDLNPPLGELASADGTVGALGVELRADARDAAENPHRGYLHSLSYQRAGSFFGGDRHFGQVLLDARQYLPLSGGKNGPVLALRVLGGTSTGTVPLPEQFWIGGYELLRGYNLYSLHGDRLLLGSVEARLPLGPGVQGVLFADYGNAWKRGEAVSLSGLHAGTGLGLRFLTPIGPIRLDAAYGSGFKTYVSLGQAY